MTTKYRVRKRPEIDDGDVPEDFEASTHATRKAAERAASRWKNFADWGEVRAITSGSTRTYAEISKGVRPLVSMKLPRQTLDDMDSLREARGNIGRTELVVQLVDEEKKRRR